MSLREAAEKALDALEKTGIEGTGLMHERAIDALRAALAEPDEVTAAVIAEREACARMCELLRPSKREYDHRFYDACTASAAVIRTRGNDEPA